MRTTADVAAHRHTVLLIEDDPAAREPLEELLRQEGLDVEIASDGAEAHEHLRGGVRPCVILLDLWMPGMDGYEFRAEQMRDPVLARIPVVVLSGSSESDDIDRAFELGARSYLVKPVAFDALVDAVTSLGLRWLLIEAYCQL